MRSLRIGCALLLALCLGPSDENGVGCAAAAFAGPAQDGVWTDTTSTACTAIHVAVLRAPGDSTQVLFWGDERELVAGAFQTTARAWRFEPGANFSLSNCFAAPVGPETFCGGHTLLSDGRLFVPGGQYVLYTGRDDAHIYAPATRSWEWQPNMRQPRWYPTATALPDGRVLVTAGEKSATLEIFGGADGATYPDTLLQCAILDTSSWSHALPSTRPSPRKNHTLTFDRKRSLSVLYGGEGPEGTLSDVWVCRRTDPATGPDDHVFTWVQATQTPDPVAGLPPARSLHSTVLVQGSPVIADVFVVYGGRDETGEPLGDTWLLRVVEQNGQDVAEWSRLDTGDAGPRPRFGHTAVSHDVFGRMLVFGGCLGETFSDSLWVLNVGTAAWTGSWTSTGPKARARHAALLSGDSSWVTRTLMIAGGADADSCMSTVWSADVGITLPLVWKQRRSLPSARRGLTLTYDSFGPTIMVGGESFAGVAQNDLYVMFLGSFAGWYPIPQSSRMAPRAGHATVYNPKFGHVRIPEIFTPSATGPGSWTALHSAALLIPMYPHMFVTPDGNVFMAGPGSTTGTLDLGTNSWAPPILAHSAAGSAAMYEPGRILRVGAHEGMGEGSSASTIDLNSPSPAWVHSDGMLARDHMNLTLLPSGEVLVTGGVLSGVSERRPQLWKPGQGWGPPLAPDPAIRGYHSTAALLPDGRILSAGGSTEIGGGPADRSKRSAAIYSPPYLFDANSQLAARPHIESAPSALAYGQAFTLCATTSPPSSIVLMRPAAVTHAFNQSQLRIAMAFTTEADPSRLHVTAPSSPNLAPPGDYLLFVVGQDSVPSLARWVRLGDVAGADSCGLLAVVAPPLRLALVGPHPNPVRDRLQVALEFAAGDVGHDYRLELYDVAGRRTQLIDSGPVRAASRVERSFPLRAPGTVRPGLYFLRLSVAGREIQKRVAVLP